MKIALNSHLYNDENIKFIEKLAPILTANGIEPLIRAHIFERTEIKQCKVFSKDEELEDVDFIFSIGGDGTMLDSAIFAKKNDIPVLGINTSRFGFLTTATTDKIEEVLKAIMLKKYTLDERTMLNFSANQDVFSHNFALNEFSILKRDSSTMIIVHAYLNGEFLNSYWADGVIVSTPTGSTGYSLSCGGPVVLPHSNNFIITPICPHNLNMRPLVVSDNSEFSFEVEARTDKFLISLDSRSETVDSKINIKIMKSPETLKIVKLEGYSYLKTLNQKLNWGNDVRNYKKTF